MFPFRKAFPAARAVLLLSCGLGIGTALAAEPVEIAALPRLSSDLTQIPFDDLMQVEVTSVSKRAEPTSTAAAAIFVLTGDEIRRSGARSIPEALRMVPGLEVGQVDGSGTYAISARGFNNTSADKLEVRLDGRSVYTPLFSGVFWDVADTEIGDIDRIEVIRGPGATLWGANSVNGVINIVTRHAKDTTGMAISGGGGNEERSFGSARMGAAVGDSGHIRVYAKAHERGSTRLPEGGDAPDGLRHQQAGFRSDWTPLEGAALTVSGDVYRGTRGDTLIDGTPTDADVRGSNVLARWVGNPGASNEWAVQVYYDYSYRLIPELFEEDRDTYDIDSHKRFQLSPGNTLVVGAGYRSSRNQTGGQPLAIVFEPSGRRLDISSAFIEDQWSLAGGKGTLTFGSKFEHNDYTGFEFQPTVRLGWSLAPQLFTWAAISRAVRTPNQLDNDIAIFCPPPDGFPGVCGPGLFRIGTAIDSETVIAYEWGLRMWAENRYSLDLATFYNDYDDLRSTEAPSESSPFGAFGNSLRGRSFGAELSGTWRPLETLDLRAWYSYLQLQIDRSATSTDFTTPDRLEGADPRHQAGLRVSYRPGSRWLLDATARYVDRLRSYDVPAYAELNLRVAFRPHSHLEIALVGQNLLDAQHPEFGSAPTRSEPQRGGFLEFRWAW